jgi:hypothetical protein
MASQAAFKELRLHLENLIFNVGMKFKLKFMEGHFRPLKLIQRQL